MIGNKEELIAAINNNSNLNGWNTDNVEDMSHLFYKSLFNQDIGNWDTSKVKNMSYMFNFSPFNQDIGKWNTSKVESMNCMFYNSPFNKDIGNWDTSNVEDMSYMFERSPFNQDVSKWDTSSVKDIKKMFPKGYHVGENIRIDTDEWTVIKFNGLMQIGCELHSIEEWKNFSDTEISKMSSKALGFWKKWKTKLIGKINE